MWASPFFVHDVYPVVGVVVASIANANAAIIGSSPREIVKVLWKRTTRVPRLRLSCVCGVRGRPKSRHESCRNQLAGSMESGCCSETTAGGDAPFPQNGILRGWDPGGMARGRPLGEIAKF